MFANQEENQLYELHVKYYVSLQTTHSVLCMIMYIAHYYENIANELTISSIGSGSAGHELWT